MQQQSSSDNGVRQGKKKRLKRTPRRSKTSAGADDEKDIFWAYSGWSTLFADAPTLAAAAEMAHNSETLCNRFVDTVLDIRSASTDRWGNLAHITPEDSDSDQQVYFEQAMESGVAQAEECQMAVTALSRVVANHPDWGNLTLDEFTKQHAFH